MTGGVAADVFNGGSGLDTVDYADHGVGSFNPQTGQPTAGEGVTVTMGAGTNDDGNSTDGAAGARDDVKVDVENLEATTAVDDITGSGVGNRINGGSGTDTIHGGDGGDVLISGSDTGADQLFGEGGDDTYLAGLFFNPQSGQSSADGSDTFDGGAGDDRVDYSGRANAVTVTLGDDATNDGEATESDRIKDAESATGGNGSDTLTGTDAANNLNGGFGCGDDVLTGLGGDDRLTGGAGTGFTPGCQSTGDGADTFSGGEGDDVLRARDNRVDTAVDCGEGAETDGDRAYLDVPANGSAVTDPNQDCEALNPADPPAASPGTVAMGGQSQSGQLTYTAQDGQENHVTARFSSLGVSVVDTAGAGPVAGAGCKQGGDHEVICSRDDTGFTYVSYSIKTGDLDDEVTILDETSTNTGQSPNGVIEGGTGDDTLAGSLGIDGLVGGSGADVLSGGEGDYDAVSYHDHANGVVVDLAGGTGGNATEDGALDTIATDVENAGGSPQADTLTGDDGRNSLAGFGGADTVNGGKGNDQLEGFVYSGIFVLGGFNPGTDGADTLNGGAGSDLLRGGPGSDVFDGGTQQDTADYNDHNTSVSPGQTGEGVTVTVGAGTKDDGNATDGAAGDRDDVLATTENVLGTTMFAQSGVTPPGDTITGDGGPNVIDGGSGSDAIHGGGGDDTLSGGSENVNSTDTSADVVSGDGGDDTFVTPGSRLGGVQVVPDGGDTFNGGDGVDRADYSGRSGNVTVSLGNDVAADLADDGQSGEGDTIGSDVEQVTGGAGADTLTGNDQANRLHGGAGTGADTIEGGAGADRIFGGYGQGLFGGGGAGDGADTLRGGAGDDTVSARDGAADAVVDCGANFDIAYTDTTSGAADAPAGCENLNPNSSSTSVNPGDTASTDPENSDPSPSDPIQTSITSPNGGVVSVQESTTLTQEPPDGSDFLSLQLDITAPDASVDDPLVIAFDIDSSLLPAAGPSAVDVYRDGAKAADCTGGATATQAIPDPCVKSRVLIAGGDLRVTILSVHASTWNFGKPKAGADTDGDGDPDSADNCPQVSNGDQANTDGDAQGNACDADDDNDGAADGGDNCPVTPNANQLNTDKDPFGNACDPDDDNDGVSDVDEAKAGTDPLVVDTDKDGKDDKADKCPKVAAATADGCAAAANTPAGTGSPTSQTGNTPAAGKPPVVTPPPLRQGAPAPLTSSVTLLRAQRLRTVLAKGLAGSAVCSRACTVQVVVRLDARTAKRLRLRGTLGKQTVTGGAGTTRFKVRLSTAAKRKLKRLRRVVFQVTVTTAGAGGAPVALRPVKVTVKR